MELKAIELTKKRKLEILRASRDRIDAAMSRHLEAARSCERESNKLEREILEIEMGLV